MTIAYYNSGEPNRTDLPLPVGQLRCFTDDSGLKWWGVVTGEAIGTMYAVREVTLFADNHEALEFAAKKMIERKA